jgi:hypothetical protein
MCQGTSCDAAGALVRFLLTRVNDSFVNTEKLGAITALAEQRASRPYTFCGTKAWRY